MLDFKRLPRFKGLQFEIVMRIPDWARAYECNPADIERQIEIAHAWCDANPRRAPRSDPMRFLFSWMRKAQEYGNLNPNPNARRYKDPPVQDDMTYEEMVQIRRRNMGETNLKHVNAAQAIETEMIE